MGSLKKLQIIKFLQIAYLSLFAVGIGIAIGNDIFHSPKFSVLKIPTYLKEVGPLIGISWPLSFDIYHGFLLVLAIIGSVNLYGINHIYKNQWRITAKFSSFIGLFVTWFMFVFFLYPLILKYTLTSESSKTALAYCVLGFIFLITNALTFFVVYNRSTVKN